MQKPKVVLVERCPSISGLNIELVQKIFELAWEKYGGPLPAEIQCVLTDMKEHCALHFDFLKDDSPTDVIAFPYQDEDLFGEVVVNRDMAIQQAPIHNQSELAEVALYFVHGCLHLLGFDDVKSAQREKMRSAEQEIIKLLAPLI